MNTILSKLLCSLFIITSISVSVPAKAGLKDTTQLLANNTGDPSVISFTKTIVKEANIIYPVVLQDHIKESIDYVEKFSNKRRDYLIRTYQRGRKLFPKVTVVLKRYHLPQELKVLLALESGFNADAVSSAGAVGYWQMMDVAAKEYGLQILNEKESADPKNKKKDDRKNFSKSTVAAAKYLKDRCKNLNNDLLMTVASYNCGIGNVWQAMRKSGKNNPDFWDIKQFLPSETRAYVMNFIALNVVFANYDKFVKNKLVFNSISVEVPVSDNLIKLNTSVTD